MIPVAPQPEPFDFDTEVRRPGLAALHKLQDENPNIESAQLPPLWRKCLPDLHRAYRGICAYVCIYIDRATGARSVDHSIAKSSKPELAYEWSNYRLACSLMNSRKGIFDDVLDPFEVQDGWFHVEFSGLQVLPAPGLPPETSRQVSDTIERLRLNAPECREARAAYFDAFRNRDISFEYLRQRCPLIAKELERQRFVD